MRPRGGRIESNVVLKAIMQMVEELAAVAGPNVMLEMPVGMVVTLAARGYAGCRESLSKEACVTEVFGALNAIFKTAINNVKSLVVEVDDFDYINDMDKLVEFMEKIAREGGEVRYKSSLEPKGGLSFL